MSDSEGKSFENKSDIPSTSADAASGPNIDASTSKTVGTQAAADSQAAPTSSHPMSEISGVAAASGADTTAKPELSTGAKANIEAAKADAKPSDMKASDFASTSITILPPLRDFGGRPSDTAGSDAKARTWPLSGAQMRQYGLAAAAVIMTVGVAGAFAITGMAHFSGDPSAKAAASASLASENDALKQTIAKLGTDVTELRTALDRASKASSTQYSRVTDRIDRMEKAQVEPNARLARLSETVERLSAAPKSQAQAQTQANTPAVEKADKIATSSNAASAKTGDITGSISAPAQAAAASEPKKPPIVEGWTVREVSDGAALIQGPFGMFDVMPGDPLPGLNRVEAIRREGGRWVVVTRKGWIVAR